MSDYPFAEDVHAALERREGPPVGYHGTSVWAVIAAAKFGALPNRGPEFDFYYLPADRTSAWIEAVRYARTNAAFHFAREFLRFDSIDAVYAAIDHGDTDIGAVLKDVNEESELLGVVIGVSPAIETLPSEPVSSPGERLVLTPARGLPLRFVASIQPLGRRDREILGDHDLQRIPIR